MYSIELNIKLAARKCFTGTIIILYPFRRYCCFFFIKHKKYYYFKIRARWRRGSLRDKREKYSYYNPVVVVVVLKKKKNVIYDLILLKYVRKIERHPCHEFPT